VEQNDQWQKHVKNQESNTVDITTYLESGHEALAKQSLHNLIETALILCENEDHVYLQFAENAVVRISIEPYGVDKEKIS